MAATIRELSDRLVGAQKSVNVLRALRWGRYTEDLFLAGGGRELPAITPEYYSAHPLGFDVEARLDQLAGLEQEIHSRLGASDAAGRIMQRMCRETAVMVRLLSSRGSRDFATLSRDLYGAADDVVAMLVTGQTSGAILHGERESDHAPHVLDAPEAARILACRLARYFDDQAAVRIALDDQLQADAVAANGCIRLQANARFAPTDLRTLEVHEGWVHAATTLNARTQESCTFLARPTASATVTQEGLAVVTESLTGALHSGRIRRLLDRVHAIRMVEHGADFLDVYRYFLSQDKVARESYRQAARVFRGSLPAGLGPFTKDLSYIRGFLEITELIRRELAAGRDGRIPLLFSGKTSGTDLDYLFELADDGLLIRPRFVPAQFRDARLLASWSRTALMPFTMAA
jgi:uncharacterized protein (TIGR02421 family)